MTPNLRGEVFRALEFKKSMRELLGHCTVTRFAARLADEGLKGRCKSIEALASRCSAFGSADSGERPYFSEVDVMMDEAQNWAPLFYLCQMHGFAIPERIDPHAELLAIEAALDNNRLLVAELEQKQKLLRAQLKDVPPRNKVVGLTAYKLVEKSGDVY